MSLPLDHLVFAGPDLEEAVARVEQRFGVVATQGGRHPGAGTRNALVRLGTDAYIEIVGPDPRQPAPDNPRWFGIDDLTEPRLVTWAVRTRHMDAVVGSARRAGLELGSVGEGSRERPGGGRIRWRLTDPGAGRFGGLLPFVLDWLGNPHPSADLPAGCDLVGLRGTHPQSAEVRRVARTLGLPLDVHQGARIRLEAELRTPAHGVLTLS